MNDVTFNREPTEEEVLTREVSDDALEAAAGADGDGRVLMMTTNPWGFIC